MDGPPRARGGEEIVTTTEGATTAPSRGSEVRVSATVIEGSVIHDRYRLERVIGRGGMADVYAGRDELLDRPIAVKIPLPPYRNDDRFVRRFAKESRAAAALNHPHVVSVFDRGDVGDTPYLVMELVEGSSLRQLIDSRGFSEEESLRIARDVCSALEYAHSRGFVHRDMKPDNVLITTDGVTKVTDFGIVRAIGDRTITSTRPLGSVAYVSPEQASGREVDARSDLYSLGIVLYELLTGTRPFEAESPIAIALAHLENPPPPVRSVVPGVSEGAEQVVARALAKDRDERFASAAEMRAAIERVLGIAVVADTSPGVVDPDAGGIASTTLHEPAIDPDAPTIPPAGEAPRGTGAHPRTVAFQAAPTAEPVGVGGSALIEEVVEATQGSGDLPDPTPQPGTTPDDVWSWNRQRLTLVLLAVAAVLVIGALYPSASSVHAPDLTGLTGDPAREVLADHDLGIVVAGFDDSSDLPEGAIVRQDPAPGTELRRGLTVQVVLSRPAG